jgi:tetrahydromethanopterin S-methyltransferase subunit G
MSEETTKNFEGGESFETRVLRELAAINSRLTALEEKVEARSYDTRPIWETVLSRLDAIESKVSRLDVIESKVEALALNLLDMRGDLERVKKRIPPAA